MRQSHNGSRRSSAFQSLIRLMLICLLKFATSTEITIERTHTRGKIQVKRTPWSPRLHNRTNQDPQPPIRLSVGLVHCLNSVLILFDRDQQYHGISQTCTLKHDIYHILISSSHVPIRFSVWGYACIRMRYKCTQNIQFDLQSAGCIKTQREMSYRPYRRRYL